MIIVIFFRGENQTEFSGNIERLDNVIEFKHGKSHLIVTLIDKQNQIGEHRPIKLEEISHYQVIP